MCLTDLLENIREQIRLNQIYATKDYNRVWMNLLL